MSEQLRARKYLEKSATGKTEYNIFERTQSANFVEFAGLSHVARDFSNVLLQILHEMFEAVLPV